MKAIVVEMTDSGPSLLWGDTHEPDRGGPEDVVIDVVASAVNRADLMQAAGHYPPPPGVSPVLGLEVSGRVAEVGGSVTAWRVGDRVCALVPGGGYAQRAIVPQGLLLRLPDSWSFEQGAAIPEVWLTAYLNLFVEGCLKPGETVLIHAGASGVGTAGIQMAASAGARVFVTAGSDEKLARCRDLGAELAINYTSDDFAKIVQEYTGGEGVSLILDPVGAHYFPRNLQTLGHRGRLVIIGLLSGGETVVNLGEILKKRLTVVGSTLRNRPVDEKSALIEEFRSRFWADLHAGRLQPIIDCVFDMREAQRAHDYVRANRNIGKVILSLDRP